MRWVVTLPLRPALVRYDLTGSSINRYTSPMKTQIKLEARERIAQILASALELSATREGGYSRLTRDDIAAHAKIPPSLITYHMGTMPELRRDIMREAVRVGNLPVIAQGLACRDRHALKASEELRQRALQSCVN
jgi:AcrR family transcriptional regulator